MRSINGVKAALFYNQMPSYLLGLILARVLQFRTILDLEDGGINSSNWSSLVGVKSQVLSWFFDTFCSGGALLACSALESKTRLRPTYCCYGAYEACVPSSNQIFPVVVLLGGTISDNTGAHLLIAAIKKLREEAPSWATKIRFEISGKGDRLRQFQDLAEEIRQPVVVVHGRLTDDEYRQVLTRTHVGLALKPNSGLLAHTTFPSKVIEFASNGILVVSTDISDVRKIFADSALYLTEDNPLLLIEKLYWIVSNREEANNLALKGERVVAALCAPEIVGKRLVSFVFDTSRVIEE
jgi:glycosyltransferase involved in cell wall biosynthesis